MISVYEYLTHSQSQVLRIIESRWGKINLKQDPEDDPTFEYFDRMMREVPRPGGGGD